MKYESKFVPSTLEDIAEAGRDVPEPCGFIENFLWSDPQLSSDPQLEGTNMRKNDLRKTGFFYGPEAVKHFFRHNRLHGMIRAHESPEIRRRRPKMGSVDQGWSLDMKFDDESFVCTVFSASDYPMYKPRGNRAGVASVSGNSAALEKSLLPTFTSLPVPKRPEVKLYYYPKKEGGRASPPADIRSL